MTQEDKELILKDLCARSFYSVIVTVPIISFIKGQGPYTEPIKLVSVNAVDMTCTVGDRYAQISGIKMFNRKGELICKPYLRPISSMTEEEVIEFESITDEFLEHGTSEEIWNTVIDWLEKQGEQKPVKVPKFKVGDFIQFKGIGHRYTIKEVCGLSHYINTCNKRMDMSYTDANFELVEQKPADNVEPKFKVGDWVVCNNGPHHIFQVIEHSWPNAKYRNINGTEIFLNVNTLYKQYHLWTIQDAKDGDVLVASDGSIFLFKGTIDCACKHYVALTTDGAVKSNEGLEHFWETSTAVNPATKEQRDLLFQKMKEAGYEWDAEKKELKKIEQKLNTQHSTEWSVSDFRTWQYIVSDVLTKKDGIGQYLDSGECKKIAKYMQEEWSKRLSTEQKPVWSEEDEGYLKVAIENCYECGNNYIAQWLKSLRP